jgi:hypothetical protein
LVYDITGEGKTVLKFHIGRYFEAGGSGRPLHLRTQAAPERVDRVQPAQYAPVFDPALAIHLRWLWGRIRR